jgi:DNA modification methylase
MKINELYNCDFLLNNLPDGCADLIIADPPYFQVKGEFDFIWPSFQDYLEDVKKWAAECDRLLADNGTLLWYGDDKRIAYAQIIFDNHFKLLNNLVWNKGENFMGLNHSEELRSFAPCTERLLMYSKDSLNLITKAKGKISLKEINTALGTATNGGGVASACLSLEKGEPTMITEEMYIKLQKYCNPYLSKEYEELRKEYEELRRPFNNLHKLSEVLNFRNEANKNAQYKHPTRKPETLTRALIETTTKKAATIIVPFAGSGTECAVALKEERNFIGYEIDGDHFKTALKRIRDAKNQPLKLF